MSGVNRVNFNTAQPQHLDSRSVGGNHQGHQHADYVGSSENSRGGKHTDCDGPGKGHCHGNNGHHKKIEELTQVLIAQMQAATQQAISEQISQNQQRINEPTPAELDCSPAKIEKLIYEAKMTRGVDQGQALRELDQLTGGQPATNALMRAIV